MTQDILPPHASAGVGGSPRDDHRTDVPPCTKRYGYEVVERRLDGPYDRIHYRRRLNSPPIG